MISIDNRRLAAAKIAGTPVNARIATPQEIQIAIQNAKFSAGRLGTNKVVIRGE
jgi:hypothetical protein